MSEPENATFEGDISPLGGLAIQMHEMFLELRRAGFAQQDAVQIVGIVLSGGFRLNYDDVEPDYQDDDDLDGLDLDLDFDIDDDGFDDA